MIQLLNSEYHLVRNGHIFACNLMPCFFTCTGSKNFSCALKDVKIPISYFKFQGIISSKVVYFEKHKDQGPPMLTWNDIVA